MRKPSRKTLSNKLDKLFSSIVRSRGACERCGRIDDTLQTAHIFTRGYRIVRWDLDNALCLCASCHFWNHKEPLSFAEWFNERFPGRHDKLKLKVQKLRPITTKEIEKIYEELCEYQ